MGRPVNPVQFAYVEQGYTGENPAADAKPHGIIPPPKNIHDLFVRRCFVIGLPTLFYSKSVRFVRVNLETRDRLPRDELLDYQNDVGATRFARTQDLSVRLVGKS